MPDVFLTISTTLLMYWSQISKSCTDLRVRNVNQHMNQHVIVNQHGDVNRHVNFKLSKDNTCVTPRFTSQYRT